jgi:hypothetical protein
MAVTGHRPLEEVECYTKAVRFRKLADLGMAKIRYLGLLDQLQNEIDWDDDGIAAV